MSAAPGAERFPDELELLDGSELCLRELEIDQSLRELRALTDTCVLQNFTEDLDPEIHEKARAELTTASQKLIWQLYDTGIFISREESLDTTKHMVCELAMRVHDSLGVKDGRDRPAAPAAVIAGRRERAALAAQKQLAVAGIAEESPREYTKPTYVRRMVAHTADQLQKDFFVTLGLHIETLHPAIAERVDHDDFVQTMISLRDLGRVSLSVPLMYGADKLRALSKLAEQLATKIAAQ